jgi:hypothetical protein
LTEAEAETYATAILATCGAGVVGGVPLERQADRAACVAGGE